MLFLEVKEEDQQWVITEARKNLGRQQNKVEEDEAKPVGRQEPYGVGDLVRYKVNDDVRNRRGGKIPPHYADPYIDYYIINNA